jgi:sugar O-acyltransferase (sialic acid O-acetyltransferase NeuD family)
MMLNFIFGASGFAKEVDWLTHEIYTHTSADYRALNFVSYDSDKKVGAEINGRKVLPEHEFFDSYGRENVNCFLSVGDPTLKEQLVLKIRQSMERPNFPSLIHPSVSYDRRAGKVVFGKGNIICANTVITTDVIFGDFVTVNLACTVGHDCRIGRFTTISPGVNLSGNVSLGDRVFIGTGTRILEKKYVSSDAIIGAGSTVVHDAEIPGTYVGTPAKMIKPARSREA